MRDGTAIEVSREGGFVEGGEGLVGWAKRSVPTHGEDAGEMVGTAQGRLCPPYGTSIAGRTYSTTGLSETSQSLPLKTWMNNVFIGV